MAETPGDQPGQLALRERDPTQVQRLGLARRFLLLHVGRLDRLRGGCEN